VTNAQARRFCADYAQSYCVCNQANAPVVYLVCDADISDCRPAQAGT